MISFNLTIVWTIVNLIVLYLIYRKFLYNRVQKTLDDRKNSINSKFKQAREEKEKALSLQKEYEDSLANAKIEARQIVEDARGRADAEYERIVNEAKAESENIIKKANETIAQEREKAMKDAQAEVRELALLAAAKIIGGASNAETNEKLYNEFLTKAGKSE